MLIPFSKRVSAYVLCISAAVVAVYAEQNAKDRIIVMPDAGRRMRLGEFYDARIDTVIPGRLWDMKGDFFDTYKYETPASHTSISFSNDESYSARTSLLGIDIEAAFRLVKGTVTIDIEGSFKYVTDDRSTNKSIKYAVAYRTRTKRETLDVFNGHMLAAANQRIFSGTDGCNDCKLATHFVSSITWGADVVASFESFYKDASEKFNMEIWLKGALELAGPTKINAEIEGRLNITDLDNDYASKTNVNIIGDLRMDREIPTTPREAIDFFKSLPELTDTKSPSTLLDNGGNGVPMSITLTPLSWIDSKAAKLKRRIKNDTLVKLINIYDSLEDSAAYIHDILNIEYAGFTYWKKSVDAYYKNFEVYRAQLVLEIFAATKTYITGDGGVNAITNIETKYWSTTNIYNRDAIVVECQERQNTIINLMALVSRFEELRITFAEDLSDFYAPTFDSSYDRVYALVVVGMNPSYSRDSITKIREFTDLAKSRLMKNEDGDNDEKYDEMYTHCVKKQVGETNKCTEFEKFVVIHFDSHCSDMCDSRFCPSTYEKDMCPITAKKRSCDYSPAEEKKFGCVANRHSGMCWVNKNGEPVKWNTPNAKMHSDHDIDNMDRPLSDCWCSCPRTQIMQFEQNGNPERLEKHMPKVPKQPTISSVMDYTENHMEDFGNNQVIKLEMLTPDKLTRSWKVFVEHVVPQEMDNGEVHFAVKEKKVYTTNKKSQIILRKLSAGQTYQVSVAGMNQVGEGRPSEKKEVTIQHRMVDLHVSEDDPAGTPATDFKSLEIQSWLKMFVQMRLSTKISGEISRVTIDYLSNNANNEAVVDETEYSDAYEGIVDITPELNDDGTASCSIEPLWLDDDAEMEIRVWDDTDLLVAKNVITFKAPTIDYCSSNDCRGKYTIIPARFEQKSCPTFMGIDELNKEECLNAAGFKPTDGLQDKQDDNIPKGCTIYVENGVDSKLFYNDIPGGKGNPAYKNVCKKKSLKLPKNKEKCEPRFADVSKEDCAGSSIPFGGEFQGGQMIDVTATYAPPGCSIQGNWYIHWNQNEKGENDGGYSPICRIKVDGE